MKLEELRRYGVADTLITQWQARLGSYLLPVQEKAVRKGLLSQQPGESPVRMLISSPTGSGKSFCAEMAAAVALSRRQKVVMLFPLKSLAEQKYRDWHDAYGRSGITCLIVTADHPENDPLFVRGDYDIALAIYEKFDQLLTVRLDVLATIGLVVVDEIQTIGEAPRGATLERLLIKLQNAVYTPSFVALSAVVGDSSGAGGRLAGWLDAQLVEERRRPIELRRGVAVGSTFHFQTFNDACEGEEELPDICSCADRREAFLRQVKNQPGQTLVFLKSRRDTVEAAHALAGEVSWPPADQAIAALDSGEPSALTRALTIVLGHGVAFHNADLTGEQRRVVEEAFLNGEIRVLFSTTTLAMGVNLSADTVYLETVRYCGGEYGGRPSLIPLSRAEYDNMTGRAGRPQKNGGDRFGRAVVLADGPFEEEVLWRNYIEPTTDDALMSVLDSMPIEDWSLNMLTSGLAYDKPSLETLFVSSFYAATKADSSWPSITAAVAHLRQAGLIDHDRFEGDRLVPTPIGRAAASVGLGCTVVGRLLRAVEGCRPGSLFGWVLLVLDGGDISYPPGFVGRGELHRSQLWQQFQQIGALPVAEVEMIFGPTVIRSERLDHAQAAAIKGAVLMTQWAELTPAAHLEERFGVHLGQIGSFAETVSHRLYSLGRLIEADGGNAALGRELTTLSQSVRQGVPSDYHELLQLQLTRAEIVSLASAGLTDFDAIAETDKECLAALLKSRARAEQIWQTFETEDNQMAHMQSTHQAVISERPVLHGGRPRSIEVDGSPDRERFVVKIDGYRVCLTGKSFKYFVKLAWARVHAKSGWLFKEDLEIGFNQARYLYRMKSEIGGQLHSRWSMVENNRLGYYRLNVDPAGIQINLRQLADHPDWEVRSLVESLSDKAVN